MKLPLRILITFVFAGSVALYYFKQLDSIADTDDYRTPPQSAEKSQVVPQKPQQPAQLTSQSQMTPTSQGVPTSQSGSLSH